MKETDAKFRSMGFAHDANGRMIKATKPSTPDASTVYDALGNRVATKINDIWTFVIYDAFGKLVAEYGGLAGTDDGGVRYVMQDWQGSPRAIVSNTGNVQSRSDFTAFGEEIQSGIGLRTSAQGYGVLNQSRQGYGLTEKDDSSGLNHTWFRKNENRAGRWTSPDPYKGSMSPGDPQSFNRYSYVINDPTNFVDPSGLQWILTCKHVGYLFDGPNSPRVYSCQWTKVESSAGGGHSRPTLDSRGGGGGGLTNATRESYDEKQRRKCFEEKKAKIDKERREYLNQANTAKRIGRGILLGVARGAVVGGFLGATGGAGFAGIGAVPGAILGAVVGGSLGGAGSSVGSPAWEIFVTRGIYDPVKYRNKLAQARAECNRRVFV